MTALFARGDVVIKKSNHNGSKGLKRSYLMRFLDEPFDTSTSSAQASSG